MKDHFGLRPTFHGELCAGSMRTNEHQTEYQHGISPTDRWTIGASQRVVGAILTHLRECRARQLGRVTANGAICAQLMDQHKYGVHTVRPSNRSHAHSECVYQCYKRARSDLMKRMAGTGTATCTSRDTKCAAIDTAAWTKEEGSTPLSWSHSGK
jgi:hypothetical protein